MSGGGELNQGIIRDLNALQRELYVSRQTLFQFGMSVREAASQVGQFGTKAKSAMEAFGSGADKMKKQADALKTSLGELGKMVIRPTFVADDKASAKILNIGKQARELSTNYVLKFGAGVDWQGAYSDNEAMARERRYYMAQGKTQEDFEKFESKSKQIVHENPELSRAEAMALINQGEVDNGSAHGAEYALKAAQIAYITGQDSKDVLRIMTKMRDTYKTDDPDRIADSLQHIFNTGRNLDNGVLMNLINNSKGATQVLDTPEKLAAMVEGMGNLGVLQMDKGIESIKEAVTNISNSGDLAAILKSGYEMVNNSDSDGQATREANEIKELLSTGSKEDVQLAFGKFLEAFASVKDEKAQKTMLDGLGRYAGQELRDQLAPVLMQAGQLATGEAKPNLVGTLKQSYDRAVPSDMFHQRNQERSDAKVAFEELMAKSFDDLQIALRGLSFGVHYLSDALAKLPSGLRIATEGAVLTALGAFWLKNQMNKWKQARSEQKVVIEVKCCCCSDAGREAPGKEQGTTGGPVPDDQAPGSEETAKEKKKKKKWWPFGGSKSKEGEQEQEADSSADAEKQKKSWWQRITRRGGQKGETETGGTPSSDAEKQKKSWWQRITRRGDQTGETDVGGKPSPAAKKKKTKWWNPCAWCCGCDDEEKNKRNKKSGKKSKKQQRKSRDKRTSTGGRSDEANTKRKKSSKAPKQQRASWDVRKWFGGDKSETTAGGKRSPKAPASKWSLPKPGALFGGGKSKASGAVATLGLLGSMPEKLTSLLPDQGTAVSSMKKLGTVLGHTGKKSVNLLKKVLPRPLRSLVNVSDVLTARNKWDALGRWGAETAGGLAGAAIGGLIGTAVLPGAGTAVAGYAGGVAGGALGVKAYELIKGWFSKPVPNERAEMEQEKKAMREAAEKRVSDKPPVPPQLDRMMQVPLPPQSPAPKSVSSSKNVSLSIPQMPVTIHADGILQDEAGLLKMLSKSSIGTQIMKMVEKAMVDALETRGGVAGGRVGGVPL